MNQIIKTETVDFNTLIKTNTTFTLDCQSKMIEILNKEFTKEENSWYIANLYIYMNYHPTNDFPITLDTLVKLVDFANKQNAKRTLVNNFVLNQDYKILLIPKDEQVHKDLHDEEVLIPKDGNLNTKNTKNLGGRPIEKVIMNIDTFKNMCMLVKTEKSKEIRKYYVKLENIYNKIVKEEIENTKNLLQQKEQLLIEKDNELENKESEKKREVENTLKNSFDGRCLVYLIKIIIDDVIIYKFGSTDDILTRIRSHKNQIGEDIELIYCIESKDNRVLEKLLKEYLEQYKFRIKRKINGKMQTELIKVNDIQIIKNKLIEINKDIESGKFLVIKLQNKITDLENENIDLKQLLLQDDKKIINDLKNKIDILEKTILNYKLDNDDDIKPFVENKDIVEDRIYKKAQVDKIDPSTLKIVETYECINAIIIKHPEYSYNQLYRCIKNNNIYKDFRWNYNGEKIKSTNKISKSCNKIERVIQLDENKNFVKIYSTKTEICNLLHIGIVRLNKYIDGKKHLNEFYYVNESSYDGEIPVDDGEKYEIHNSKQIKELNIETNEIIIYKTMKELYEKRGISRCTLRNCIKTERVCDKYKWTYVNNNQNKNNSKKVKEINVINNTFIIYDSMKKAYTKLNSTLEKLRNIIKNKEIINDCSYEFC
jgi:hypothetical protein